MISLSEDKSVVTIQFKSAVVAFPFILHLFAIAFVHVP